MIPSTWKAMPPPSRSLWVIASQSSIAGVRASQSSRWFSAWRWRPFTSIRSGIPSPLTSWKRRMKPARNMGWDTCVAAAALLVWAAAATSPAHAADNSACTACHDQGAKLEKSAHASVACASCHVKHDDYPHPAGTPKPACSQCHQGQQADYDRGVHGQEVKSGNSAAPDCSVCHGAAHELLRTKSSEFRDKVPDTC